MMGNRVDAQTTLEQLVAFVQRERLAQQEESTSLDQLSIRAQVALGYALEPLYFVRQQAGEVLFRAGENNSRFRPGDPLVMKSGKVKVTGTLLNIENNPNGAALLTLRSSKPPADLPEGPWLALGTDADHLSAVVKALEKLQPGAPGWGLAKRLAGEAVPPIKPLSEVQEHEYRALYETIVQDLPAESRLDNSQRRVFLQCAAAPPVLGVQGPPGTGKTYVLAFVVEALARRGKRVMLLAPTHQAVNNALSTIRKIFPQRKLIKYGDEFKSEGLAPGIQIIPSVQNLPPESHETVIGMSYQAAVQRLMLSDHKALSPHVLVIDEAGQLPLAQGICAGLSGAGSILLFGDDQQMPPVFSGEATEEPYALSAFAQLRRVQPEAIHMLEITYRLNADLCAAIGAAFYENSSEALLKPSESAKDRRLNPRFSDQADQEFLKQALAPERSLVWIKVAETNALQQNPKEARVVAEIVNYCLENGLNSREIAVVTPFRRQAMLIRKLLQDARKTSKTMPIVDTVERVQGATVEMVVVSLCASQPDYVASLAGFLFSPNRLNVAVSRARTKAIVVASPDLFQVTPDDFRGLIYRNRCKKFLDQCFSLLG